MAEISGQRFVHAVVEQLFKRGIDLAALIVRDNARHHGDGARAGINERAQRGKVFRQLHGGEIYIVRLQLRQFGRELFRRAHLIYARRVGYCGDVHGRGGDAQSPAFGRFLALRRELGDQLAAQLVYLGCGQVQPRLGLGLILNTIIGRSAGFEHLFDQILLGKSLALCALRHGAGGNSLVPVVVKSDSLDMLALFEHRVKMHRHAAHLALGVLLAGCCEYLVRVLVRLRAHAEHIELVADEVALSEALTGKGLLQQLHLLFIGVALLADSLGVDAGDYAGVLRTLHASLYLEATPASSRRRIWSTRQLSLSESGWSSMRPPRLYCRRQGCAQSPRLPLRRPMRADI